MQHLTKRGHLVLGIVIGLLIAAIVWISGHLWYVPGEGYCKGTMAECYEDNFH